MKKPTKREGSLKIEVPFDEAVKLAMSVKPPPEGWAAYEKKLKASRKRQTSK